MVLQLSVLTGGFEAGVVELAHVKLHPDDGKHDDGEEEQQADLKQRDHGFHYGLQHHLETWGERETSQIQTQPLHLTNRN